MRYPVITLTSKDTVFDVNPRARIARDVAFIIVALCLVAGIGLLFVNHVVGIIVECLGLVVLLATLPYVHRNLDHYVVVRRNEIALIAKRAQRKRTGLFTVTFETYYVKKAAYNLDDVRITLVGPIRNRKSVVYRAFINDHYLVQDGKPQISKKDKQFSFVLTEDDLDYLHTLYKRPFEVLLFSEPGNNDYILKRCQYHNYLADLRAKQSSCPGRVNFDKFKQTSVRALVAYSICCLENALEYFNQGGDGWQHLLGKLWQFTQIEEGDDDALRNWFGIADLLPNKLVTPYDKYLTRSKPADEDIKLERVDEPTYQQIATCCENCHSVVAELCDGVYNVAASTLHEIFRDVAYVTLANLQETVLDVMYLNRVPLPKISPLVDIPYELPLRGSAYSLGSTFDGTQYSKFLKNSSNE